MAFINSTVRWGKKLAWSPSICGLNLQICHPFSHQSLGIHGQGHTKGTWFHSHGPPLPYTNGHSHRKCSTQQLSCLLSPQSGTQDCSFLPARTAANGAPRFIFQEFSLCLSLTETPCWSPRSTPLPSSRVPFIESTVHFQGNSLQMHLAPTFLCQNPDNNPFTMGHWFCIQEAGKPRVQQGPSYPHATSPLAHDFISQCTSSNHHPGTFLTICSSIHFTGNTHNNPPLH